MNTVSVTRTVVIAIGVSGGALTGATALFTGLAAVATGLVAVVLFVYHTYFLADYLQDHPYVLCRPTPVNAVLLVAILWVTGTMAAATLAHIAELLLAL